MYAETENNCSLLNSVTTFPLSDLHRHVILLNSISINNQSKAQGFIELSRRTGDNLSYKPKPQKGKIVT